MRTSPRGFALIESFEGLELEAYQDIAEVWTIGRGATEGVAPGDVMTKAEADARLRTDVAARERVIERLVTADLNQNEFDALVSFVYNIGEGDFAASTALRRLNAGNRVGAAEAMTWFNKARVEGVLTQVAGLVRRRAAERELFLTPMAPRSAEGVREAGVVSAPGIAPDKPGVVQKPKSRKRRT